MRILLIKARLASFYGQTVPPLGLLYLAAALKADGRHDVSVLHPDALGLDDDALEAAIRAFAPDLVGISAITAEGASLHALAALVKKARPGTPVIAGGPYPTGHALSCAADPAITAVVRGEGELTLLELVSNLSAGRPLAGVAGTVCKDGDRIVEGPPRPFIEDLDSLPFPDWGALDLETYRLHIPQTPVLYGERYAGVLTSRGCPYNCVFCHGVMGKRYRAHSPQRVLAELRRLRDSFSVAHVEITDDTFNWNRERAATILRGAAEAGGQKLYLCGIRTDLLDEEFIELMAKAGVVYVATGAESGSQRVQRAIRKNVDLEKFSRFSALLVKHRIFVTAGFMLGFPGETFREMFQTLRYLWRLRVHTVMLAFCRAYAGTELEQSVSAERVLSPFNDTEPFYGTSPGQACSSAAPWALALLKWLGNTIFYFNPARVLRILRDLPNPSQRVFLLLLSKLTQRTFFLR